MFSRHLSTRFSRRPASASLFATCAHAQGDIGYDSDRHNGGGRHVKVMIVSMFGPEGQVWLDNLGPWQTVTVPGLSPDYPNVNCNRDDVCVMTTGMGHANAATSIMALVFSDLFDLRRTYFLVAGIAGIDPARGTLGSAAWAKYLVDFGIQWELDAREKPTDWPTGFLGINTKSPTEKPPLDYRTEVFALNASLADAVYSISRNVKLSDSDEAKVAREVQLRASESTACRHPVRHARRRHLVVGKIYRRTSALLDASVDRRQRRLLHDAAGGQRDVRGAQARGQREACRSVTSRRAQGRLRFRPAV